ncbi:uncharacterized protein JCM6883_001904 [Sporobolomyces salmoneus]|uniref:uncharacterized protein n=1 Tax=Sporobolomyces salmoneus TaxID=183962 RepID=UPI00317492A9
MNSTTEEDNPESIWSNPTPPPAQTESESRSTPPVQSTNDIWASVPSTSTSSSSGYHPTYISTPPPDPVASTSESLSEFDPFSPSTSRSQTAAATTPTTLLGSGIRKNSRLVLIDTDSDDEAEEREAEIELRKRLEREALELHERDKAEKRAQKEKEKEQAGSSSGGGGGFNFVGNMFKTLSSAATSPSTSRPTTPNVQPSTTSTTSTSNTTPQRPRPQSPTNTNLPPESPLQKPFASIASVFRSSPSTSQSGSSSSTNLVTAIAGKGKEKQSSREEEGETMNEKQPRTTRKREKRPDPTFDFTKFLEQMRSRQADPIAKYLRSFLKEFSRKPIQSTNDQTKVINDFLDFIASKMRQTDPWKSIYQDEASRPLSKETEVNEKEQQTVGEKELEGVERAEFEFDLSLETMEKLVMNRLWHLTFTPALDPAMFEQNGGMSPSGDLERDQVVRQRIRLFGWIEPKHLDLPISVDQASSGDVTPENEEETEKEGSREKKPGKKGSERGFIDFAASELRKMNQYKAPRDKLICVLNCCKVIFGLIRHVASSAEEQGADTFIPFLIYVVLQANPDHLVSNLQYIQRFRNPEKLAGEGGYYLSSLNAAISFIETLDASALSNIDQSEFEHNVANAVKLLASEEPPPPPPPRSTRPLSSSSVQQDLEAARPGMPSPLNSSSNLHSTATDETSSASLIAPSTSTPNEDPNSTKNLLLRGSDSVERAMSKPIGALARIFEQLELTANEITGQTSSPPSTPGPGSPASNRPPGPHRRSTLSSSTTNHPGSPLQMHSPPSPDPALYAPSGVSDAKISETIERQEREEHEAKMNTLMELFSSSSSGGGGGANGEEGAGGGIEREVMEIVLFAEGGDVGRAVERLLEMV